MPSKTGWAIYFFHMPLFFMISGYLYKSVSFKKEICKSSQSLLLPYFLYNAVLILLSVVTETFEYSFIPDILAGNQEMLPGNYRALWFVVALFNMRIITSLIKEKYIVPLSAILFITYYVIKKLNHIPYDTDILQLNTTMLCYPFSAFGILLRHKPAWDAPFDRIRNDTIYK